MAATLLQSLSMGRSPSTIAENGDLMPSPFCEGFPGEIRLTVSTQQSDSLKVTRRPATELEDDAVVIRKITVGKDGRALRLASCRLKDDAEVVRVAVGLDGWALSDASERLKDDVEIVKVAVGKNGGALSLASKRLKDDAEVVKIAIGQAWWSIQFASKRLQADSDLVNMSERLKDDADAGWGARPCASKKDKKEKERCGYYSVNL